jgi:DNA-binding response OmpR family regulator
MRILLIEDDAEQATALARLLEKISENKLSIDIAHTLKEGIRKSQAMHPDVCYLDLSLPDASVDEVIGSIKFLYPPVIVITALDDPNQDLKLECFAHGAQNFFQKPKDMRLLVPHLLSTGAAAHLRREAPRMLAGFKRANANE